MSVEASYGCAHCDATIESGKEIFVKSDKDNIHEPLCSFLCVQYWAAAKRKKI